MADIRQTGPPKRPLRPVVGADSGTLTAFLLYRRRHARALVHCCCLPLQSASDASE